MINAISGMNHDEKVLMTYVYLRSSKVRRNEIRFEEKGVKG